MKNAVGTAKKETDNKQSTKCESSDRRDDHSYCLLQTSPLVHINTTKDKVVYATTVESITVKYVSISSEILYLYAFE